LNRARWFRRIFWLRSVLPDWSQQHTTHSKGQPQAWIAHPHPRRTCSFSGIAPRSSPWRRWRRQRKLPVDARLSKSSSIAQKRGSQCLSPPLRMPSSRG
ncbi:unnamed protein product, partial [Ectocarpus sp. 12 AP-2014]